VKAQDLLERSKALNSEAEALLQEIGESKEYWQTRILESERRLLIKNIDDFQKDLMKDVEEARATVPHPDNILLEAHKSETWDRATGALKRVNQYIFSTRVIEKPRRDLAVASRMVEKEHVKYLWVKPFETAVEGLKREIMEGKKDSLLGGRVDEIVYNLF